MRDHSTDTRRRPIAGEPYDDRRDSTYILPDEQPAQGFAGEPRRQEYAPDAPAYAPDRSTAAYPSDRPAAPYAGAGYAGAAGQARDGYPDQPPAERAYEPAPPAAPMTPPSPAYAPTPAYSPTPSSGRAYDTGAYNAGAYDHRDVVMDDPDAPVAEDLETGAKAPVHERRFSLGATLLGWAVASFFTFVFFVAAAALLGTTEANLRNDVIPNDAAGIANVTAASVLVSMLLGYFIGGYAAGRISLWDGAKHGALTVIWPVVLGVLAAIGGYFAADAFNATLPAGLSAGQVTTGALVAGLLSLAVMLVGGALGGRLGERYRHHGAKHAGRRASSRRGRPL